MSKKYSNNNFVYWVLQLRLMNNAIVTGYSRQEVLTNIINYILQSYEDTSDVDMLEVANEAEEIILKNK